MQNIVIGGYNVQQLLHGRNELKTWCVFVSQIELSSSLCSAAIQLNQLSIGFFFQEQFRASLSLSVHDHVFCGLLHKGFLLMKCVSSDISFWVFFSSLSPHTNHRSFSRENKNSFKKNEHYFKNGTEL